MKSLQKNLRDGGGRVIIKLPTSIEITSDSLVNAKHGTR